MDKRALSIFLLLLFSLVIVFPGYSQNVRPKADVKIVVLDEARHIADLEAMFKKCLSCGIANNGPVNEEAPSSSSEERADHGEETTIGDFALIDCRFFMNIQSVTLLFEYKQHAPIYTAADITTPPPDRFICC
jgi:hypothetical protein